METTLTASLRAESPKLLETLLSAITKLNVSREALRKALTVSASFSPIYFLMEHGKEQHLDIWLNTITRLNKLTQEDRYQLVNQSQNSLSPLYAALIHRRHAVIDIYLAALVDMNLTSLQTLNCLSNHQAGLHNLLYIPVALNDHEGLELLLLALSKLPLSGNDLYAYLAGEYQVSPAGEVSLIGKTAFQLAIYYADPEMIRLFAHMLKALPLSPQQIQALLWSKTSDGENALTWARYADSQHYAPVSLTTLFEQIIHEAGFAKTQSTFTSRN